eukprot:768746-Hanusia_phi.AAC.13
MPVELSTAAANLMLEARQRCDRTVRPSCARVTGPPARRPGAGVRASGSADSGRQRRPKVTAGDREVWLFRCDLHAPQPPAVSSCLVMRPPSWRRGR